MKIAIVVTDGLHPSSEEQQVLSWLALFEELAKTHTIHAFALQQLPQPQTYSLRGFTVHDLGRPRAPLGFTRSAQDTALARALDEHGPFDLIHGLQADPAGQLAARAGKRLAIASVVTCDNGEFVSLPAIRFGAQRTRTGRRAVREACALASSVHVCTKYMAALAGAQNVHTTVIPLTPITSQAATLKSAFARRIDGGFRIVQIGALDRINNQRLLIDAFRIVREKVEAHLDLIGEDRLSGRLQQHAARIGLSDHVTFHGSLPMNRVLEMLGEADLYVQSSLHEASGAAVLEAAASGVATVGTLTGYVADWSPIKAMAVGDAIAESLADAILELHADPDRRRSMAALARTFSIAHDAAWAATQFDRLYRGLTA